MAKLFLFIFTILFSLSLGLFVGQNFLLTDESNKKMTKSNSESIESNFLNLNIKPKFNEFMDKIFANESIKSFKVDTETDFQPETEVKNQYEDNSSSVKTLTVQRAKEELSDETRTSSEILSENNVAPTSSKDTVSNTDSNPDEVKWVIQVAAFQEESDALTVQEDVKNSGFPGYIYKTTINEQIWYRVNVGPFKSISEAASFKQNKKVHIKFKGAFVKQL